MSYLEWRVGMKLVCVAPTALIAGRMKAFSAARFPAHGVIYTLRDMQTAANSRDGFVVFLNEIDNSQLTGKTFEILGKKYKAPSEPGFAPSCFRPLVKRETSIEVFTAMLNPSDQKVSA